MVKSTKTPPPRKPIRARGALPTPKSTPQRTKRRWYRNSGYQLIAIAVIIGVIGTIWAAGGSWLKERRETRTNEQAVAGFDRRYSVLKSPVVDVLSAMSEKTNAFSAGTLPAPEFQKETEAWLVELRKMDAALRQRSIPPGLPELDEARAVLVHGYLIFIDSVKVLATSAGATDPALKNEVLKQGNALAAHAGSLVTSGETLLQRLKVRFDLEEPAQGETAGTEGTVQPLRLPPEEVPPASDGGAGQGTAGGMGGTPPDAGTAPPASP